MNPERALRALGSLLGLVLLGLAVSVDWPWLPGEELRSSGQLLLVGLGLILLLLSGVYSSSLEGVRRRYSSAAVLAFNTLLVFLLVNTALAAVFFASGLRRMESMPYGHGPLAKYGMETMQRVYPGWSEEEVRALLAETYRPLTHQPFTMFREAPLSGRYVTVDEHGFRHGASQAPWPPSDTVTNVFVFGGSTTFGYGVADHETIPSHLQRALEGAGCGRPVRVYNFGRAFHYSTQERILFEQLLVEGFRPDLALFIDGLNDAHRSTDAPEYASEMARMFRLQHGDELWKGAASRLPLVQAVQTLRRGAGGEESDGAPAVHVVEEQHAARVLDRLSDNRRLIRSAASAFGVRTAFVWQPVPGFRYDESRHPFAIPAESEYTRRVASAYRRMEASVLAGEAPGVLWLGSLQEGRAEPLYVDAIHYAPRLSREIAEEVAEHLGAERLVCGPAPERRDARPK